MKMNKIETNQRKILKALSGKIDDFYLAGGTALSLFYFQHRLSVDLDFFTSEFESRKVEDIVGRLKSFLGVRIELAGSSPGGKTAEMAVYNVCFTEKDKVKVDFVEDFEPLIKKPDVVNGIRILSLEDIYIRKIRALAGARKVSDAAGRSIIIGGRSDSKDFYDVYYLSHTFMPLSVFAYRYGDSTMREALIRWFRTYDRMSIMDGILTLKTDKDPDYRQMERHFKTEIDRLIGIEAGDI